jgi:uncharacterized protein (DUF58 family)
MTFVDPEALMRIRSLELRAKVVVEGLFHGLHRSPFHGFSVEFSEYRQYSPGDDPRYLDWRLYARSDRYYIRRFEDETNLRCHLLVDRSRSMAYGSVAYSKGEYARTAAATLAYFLASQRDAVGLVTFDDKVIEYIPARYRPGHFRRLVHSLDGEASGRATDVGAPIEEIARTVTKRSMIVLISDLLAPLDSLEVDLGFLRSRGHDAVIFHIIDPAEAAFEFVSPSVFEDLESGRDLYVDAQAVRDHYLRGHREHAARIERACASLGIDYHRFTTDRPLELALLDFVSARLRRGRRTLRRRGGRGGAPAHAVAGREVGG